MKGDLLGLRLLDQFLDPIKYWLIRDTGRQNTLMLDLIVEFDTLFAHGIRLKVTGGKQPTACYLMTATEPFCFSQIRSRCANDEEATAIHEGRSVPKSTTTSKAPAVCRGLIVSDNHAA